VETWKSATGWDFHDGGDWGLPNALTINFWTSGGRYDTFKTDMPILKKKKKKKKKRK
jgi:hypothetical protein